MAKIAPKAGVSQGNLAQVGRKRSEAKKKGSQSQPINQPSEWVSQAEAARMRGVSRQAIRKLVLKGKLSVFRIGGKTLLKREEVANYKIQPAGRPASK